MTHEEVLRLYRFYGSNLHIYAADVDTTGNVVTATQVVTFSQWALGQRSPTAMYIASFTAVPIVKGVLLEWETATEIDNLGFNLYRADDPVGELLRLNEVLIPSQMPGSSIGVRYQFVDRLAEPGVTYYERPRHRCPAWTSVGHCVSAVAAPHLPTAGPQIELSQRKVQRTFIICERPKPGANCCLAS